MTTKLQEQKALDQIRKIIAGLGDDSYLSTAFAGCLEDAESNIRDDAAYSMLDRWTSERNRADQLAAKLTEAERENEKVRAMLKAAEDGAGIIAQKLQEAVSKRLPSDLYRDLWLWITGDIDAATQEASRSADLLAQLADTPNDIAVKHGLQALKASTIRRDTAAGLLARLEQYE